ncbi:hypothetical protein [Agrobacterium tumefaciens]|uniref:hypothetical protein n=1 Tax=Agrobacterium tumefaciens TaxID=358 RepID=UPI000DDA32A1|nr:hypothetical protein [Agrobacterium tumefaciens]
MTDEITSSSLVAFLDRVGLPASARDRVIAIDRELARELESDHPDTDSCASLVLEAADLIAYGGPVGFDWSGWSDDDPSEYPEKEVTDHV